MLEGNLVLVSDAPTFPFREVAEVSPDLLILDNRRPSKRFFTQLNSFPKPPAMVISLGSTKRSLPGSPWARREIELTHQQLGGITDCRAIVVFWINTELIKLSDVNLQSFASSPKPSAAPCDHYETSIKGREVPAPTLRQRTTLLDWNKIKAELHAKERSHVIAPCYFASSGWVSRPLTLGDLAVAMDVDKIHLKHLNVHQKLQALNNVFLPGKLVAEVMRIGKRILQTTKLQMPRPTQNTCRRRKHYARDSTWAGVGTTRKSPLVSLEQVLERFKEYTPQEIDWTDSKAATHDDEKVMVEWWDDRCKFILKSHRYEPKSYESVFNTLRRWMLKRWKRNVESSWNNWWEQNSVFLSINHPDHYDLIYQRGVTAVNMAKASSFWEWQLGSAVFFWRWPKEWQLELAIGLPPMWMDKPPVKVKRQRPISDTYERDALASKITKLWRKGYLQKVTSYLGLLNTFGVVKAETDRRPVFDATASGLNEALYAPWFYLPTVDSLLRAMDYNYYGADIDFGEHFYNFWLHPELMPYSVVDATTILESEADGQDLFLQFTRPAMGEKPSPYGSVKYTRRLLNLIMDDPLDENNAFAWDHVVENLPGMEDYKPWEPNISKRRKDGKIAADATDYVDDMRASGPTREETHDGAATIAKESSHRGNQVSARKYRIESLRAGAWSGGVVGFNDQTIVVTVTQSRWEKLKSIIADLRSHVFYKNGHPRAEIELEPLESIAGFINYVARTFPWLLPYLYGVYLQLNSWRPNRDSDGWKDDDVSFDELDELYSQDCANRPFCAKRIPRLIRDVLALEALTASSVPVQRVARPMKGAKAIYSFGDASGQFFGQAEYEQHTSEIRVDIGKWTQSASDKGSNFREFATIVLKIEDLETRGKLSELSEVFIFTDNFVSESVFHKGNARSKTLFDLMLRLHLIMMRTGASIHVIWVAGQRMIANGVDGCSRADYGTGIASATVHPLDFVPLHLSAFDRSPSLLQWLRDVFNLDGLSPLSPADWYLAAQRVEDIHLWGPAPAAANAAVELLAKSIQVQPHSCHIWLVPSLWTATWRKTLRKAADVTIDLPFDPSLWNPRGRLNYQDFTNNSTIICVVCRNPVSHTSGVVCGNYGLTRLGTRACRGAWHARCFHMDGSDPFPRALVPKADLRDKGGVTDWEFTPEETEAKAVEFTRTYGGAHLICPFQCEDCHFENIHFYHATSTQDPITTLKKKAIRRALLDAFSARAESTISSNAAKLKEIMETCHNIRMPPPTNRVPRGPFPVSDQDGMSAAILMLLSSLNPGKNSNTIQWATIRSIRSALSNYHRTSPEAQTANVEADEPKGSFRFTDSPTSSRWFSRFSTGMHARLGDVVIQDKAITVDELKALHHVLEEEWSEAYAAQNQDKLFVLATVGALSSVAFGGALRGEELAFIRLKESVEHTFEGRHHGRRPHLTVCMEGKFKTEKGRKKHFLALALLSKSGIKYGHWLFRLLWLYVSNGVREGPMFKTKLRNKRPASIAALDKLWLPYLKQAVPIVYPTIIPENVSVDGFSCRRSFRRGATTQAQNVQLPENVINTNNRWRQVDKSGLRVSYSSLIQTYTDMVAAIDARLVFSESL